MATLASSLLIKMMESSKPQGYKALQLGYEAAHATKIVKITWISVRSGFRKEAQVNSCAEVWTCRVEDDHSNVRVEVQRSNSVPELLEERVVQGVEASRTVESERGHSVAVWTLHLDALPAPIRHSHDTFATNPPS